MEGKQVQQDYSVINLEPSSPLQHLVVVNVGRDREEAQAQYACSFCDRRFLSKQGLGGHQNAHRLVRNAVTRKRQVAPSSSSFSSSSRVPKPASAVRFHTGGQVLWGEQDPASVADAPVVDWTRAWGHDSWGEAAAEPEMDLSLKLWSG